MATSRALPALVLSLSAAAPTAVAARAPSGIGDDEARASGPGHPWQGGASLVNPWSFALNTALPLVEWSGRGENRVSFALHHCSRGVARNPALGPKWLHTYDVQVRRFQAPDGTPRAAVLFGDHRIALYSHDGAAWRSDDGYDDELETTATGSTLTLHDGRRLEFERTAAPALERLRRVLDRAGNATHLLYNRIGRLTTVSDRLVRTLELGYRPSPAGLVDVGPLETVTFRHPGGSMTWRIVHDAAGDLVGVSWPAVTIRGRLLRPFTRLTYSSDGRHDVVALRDRQPQEWVFEYAGDGAVSSLRLPGAAAGERMSFLATSATQRVVTDQVGTRVTRDYDALVRLVRVEDSMGVATTFQWIDPDAPFRPSSITTPFGGVRHYDWDAHGRVLTATDLVAHEYGHGWGMGGRLESIDVPQVTDAWGNVEAARRRFEFDYDAENRLIERRAILPGGGAVAIRYAYGSGGELLSAARDADRLDYRFDAFGNLTRVETPAGRFVEWRFEDAAATSGFRFPDAIVDGEGRRGDLRRDEWGRLVEELFPDGSGRTWTLDALDRVVKVDSASGVTRVSYAPQGWIVDVSTPAGIVHYERRANGQIARIDATPAGSATRTLLYTYDGAGRLVQLDDGGRVTRVDWGADGLPSEITLPSGASRTFLRDAAGRVRRLEHRGADGVVFASYDREWQENGLLRCATENDAFGSVTVRYGWDFLDQLVREERSGALTDDRQWSYDAAGRRVLSVKNGAVTTYGYDPDGRLLNAAGPAGTDFFGWDANGRLSDRWRGGRHHRFAYDFSGRLTAIDEQMRSGAWQPVAAYAYDGLGRRMRRTAWSGFAAVDHQFLFDGVRPLAEHVSISGVPVGELASSWLLGLNERHDVFSGALVAPAADGFGTLRAYSDGAGAAAFTGALHDAFGDVIAGWSPFEVGFAADSGTREELDAGLLFDGGSGGFFDPVAGLVLPGWAFQGLVLAVNEDEVPLGDPLAVRIVSRGCDEYLKYMKELQELERLYNWQKALLKGSTRAYEKASTALQSFYDEHGLPEGGDPALEAEHAKLEERYHAASDRMLGDQRRLEDTKAEYDKLSESLRLAAERLRSVCPFLFPK